MSDPTIKTTVVGSYPIPSWLAAYPTGQGLADATAVVLKTQELAGIDVVADGELYRFDVNHPDTNGMIDYFVKPLANIRYDVGRADIQEFRSINAMDFRKQPCGVVEGPIGEGTLNLPVACSRAHAMTQSEFKFTVTGPHMLSKTVLDHHYPDVQTRCTAMAEMLAAQVRDLDADIVQIDEANITGHPEDAPWALDAINTVLDAAPGKAAVHMCFGNYGGQTIQTGDWSKLVDFLGGLHANHVLLELARRDGWELEALRDANPNVGIGLGVVDIKSNVIETPDEIAKRIDSAVKTLGEGRVTYVNPDCGFWMLPRSVADGKMRALVAGRDRYEGR